MTSLKRFLHAAALAIGLTSASGVVLAAADGNGLCSPAETSKFECATFGSSVIEFLGSFPAPQCALAAGGTAPCTAYFYRYTGGTTNQLNVALPLRLTKTFKTAADINCSQFLTGGAGDPTTGFGKNQLTLGVCRIATNLAANPAGVMPPAGANFVLTVDPSAFDAKNPLDWQLRQPLSPGQGGYNDEERRNGCRVFAASLLGPFGAQPEVLESAVTLTTPGGQSVSYSNIGGNVNVTSGNARVIPQGGTKLCTLNVNGTPVPYTSPDFAANWTCETITYASEQCDIKTDGKDPCRMIGGTCIKYPATP